MATVRRTGRPSPVQRGTVAMLTMTPPTTGCQYGPRAAGPFSQREARRRPGLPQSAKGVAGPRKPATPSLEACATLRRQVEVRLQ